jgi:RNA polymerase sigma factor (sigma-70 family)
VDDANARAQLAIARVLGHVTAAALDEYATANEFLETVVGLIREEMQYDFFAIGLVDESGWVTLNAAYGIPLELANRMRVEPGQGIVGWVAEHGQPLLVPDVRAEPRYRAVIPQTRSELCVPLKTHKQVIGIINAESRYVGRFTPLDLELLTMIADISSGPLERLLRQDRAAQAEREKLARLTPREQEVLRRVAGGKSNKEIARELGISVKTVESHIGRLLAKLGVASRTEAARWFYHHRSAGDLIE